MASSKSLPRREFPSTHWSLVRAAGEGDQGQRALERWLHQYLPALKAHLCRTRGLAPEAAEDLLQSFVLDKVIQGRLLSHADRRRGRLRSFLLTSLDNYLRNAHRRANTQRRHPGRPLCELSAAQGQPGPTVEPGQAFQVAWARQVLHHALERMQQACLAEQREAVWEVFLARVVRPTLEAQVPEAYETLAERLGFRTPTEASNALVTAKRRFRRMLETLIGEYARDRQEIQEELQELRRILASGAPDRPDAGVYQEGFAADEP